VWRVAKEERGHPTIVVLECSGLAELSFTIRVAAGIVAAMKEKAVTSPRTPKTISKEAYKSAD